MKAIFLDRDGTLIYDTGYPINFSEVELIPGAPESLRLFQKTGFELFIVSNQSGVARGYFSEEDVEAFHAKLLRFFSKQGISIRKIAYCPHHPDGKTLFYRKKCSCRKPGAGMVLDLAREFQIDLSASYVVGDKLSDAQVSENCPARGVLVATGKEPPPSQGHSYPIFSDLLSFAQSLFKQHAKPKVTEGPI